VGEWAKVWPLHMLIRAMGACFVRRDSGDALYRKVLERYIDMASREGVCQAVYLEGGLSRDGRLRLPKLGLLDYMLRGFDPERDRDIVFIPVGINYERTIEDRTLLRSQVRENPKRSRWFVLRTTCAFILRNLAQMVLGRWHHFGYACVNFGIPLSAKAYCEKQHVRFDRLDRPQRFEKVQSLAQMLMGAVSEVIPILPVSLVATVFVNAPRAYLDIKAVEEQCRLLLADLQRKGAPVLTVTQSTRTQMLAEAVNHLHMRHLLTFVGGRYAANDKELPLLTYYANAIAHWWESPVLEKGRVSAFEDQPFKTFKE
jgi:glycerol-3-phosphate O-acyltransferase